MKLRLLSIKMTTSLSWYIRLLMQRISKVFFPYFQPKSASYLIFFSWSFILSFVMHWYKSILSFVLLIWIARNLTSAKLPSKTSKMLIGKNSFLRYLFRSEINMQREKNIDFSVMSEVIKNTNFRNLFLKNLFCTLRLWVSAFTWLNIRLMGHPMSIEHLPTENLRCIFVFL